MPSASFSKSGETDAFFDPIYTSWLYYYAIENSIDPVNKGISEIYTKLKEKGKSYDRVSLKYDVPIPFDEILNTAGFKNYIRRKIGLVGNQDKEVISDIEEPERKEVFVITYFDPINMMVAPLVATYDKESAIKVSKKCASILVKQKHWNYKFREDSISVVSHFCIPVSTFYNIIY